MKNSVVFWMNIPSSHQDDLFANLDLLTDEFEVVYAHKILKERLKLGWEFEHKNKYKIDFISNIGLFNAIKYIYLRRKKTHIVNGIWAEPAFVWAICWMMVFRVKFFIYAEKPVERKRSILKKIIIYSIVLPFSNFVAKKSSGIFSVGKLGFDFYKSKGWKDYKNYSFAYFRNQNENIQIKKIDKVENFNFIFIGQLIERKGLFTLLKAINLIKNKGKKIKLTIIGDGVQKIDLEKFVVENNISSFVQFIGVVQSKAVPDYIKLSDVLVLPSFFDGWGMVVNEALQYGVPVIASDGCGSAQLIVNGKNGYVFKNGNENDLAEKILLITEECDFYSMRNNALKVGSYLSPEIAAKYLLLCVEHALLFNYNSTKPLIPWLQKF